MKLRAATPILIAATVLVFAVTFSWWSEFLISDACYDAGGAWEWDTNKCLGVEGFESRQWPIAMRFVQLTLPAILAAVIGFGIYVVILIIQRRLEATHGGENP